MINAIVTPPKNLLAQQVFHFFQWLCGSLGTHTSCKDLKFPKDASSLFHV